MSDEDSMIITTCADKEAARKIADILVGKRLAACAQMFSVESVYRWRGEICDDNETVLLIKSKTVLFDKIAAAIRENHSYEVPEIIRIPIDGGLQEYLRWIDECVE